MGTYFSPMLNMHFSDKEQAEKFEKEAILKEQRRQNELLKEQNRLMSANSYNSTCNYSYYRNTSDDISFLGLLSILSIIPIAVGFCLVFLTMGEGTEEGIKILLAGLVCPGLQGLIHLIKNHKKQNKRK